jgi:hypothetical protein
VRRRIATESGPQSLALIQGAAHEAENLLGLTWLLDDRECPGDANPVCGRGIDSAADYDDRMHVAAAPYGFEKLDAAHSRHVNIEDQAVALAGSAGIEKPPARCELLRVEAITFEQKPKRIPHSRIIVYHGSFPGPHLGHVRRVALCRLDLDQLNRLV